MDYYTDYFGQQVRHYARYFARVALVLVVLVENALVAVALDYWKTTMLV